MRRSRPLWTSTFFSNCSMRNMDSWFARWTASHAVAAVVILTAKTQEAGGFAGLKEIQVPGPNTLIFCYEDGRQVELAWAHPSRRDSWTPEMREAARQKSKESRRAAQ